MVSIAVVAAAFFWKVNLNAFIKFAIGCSILENSKVSKYLGPL